MTGLQRVPLRYVAIIDPGKSQVAHLPDSLDVDFVPMEDVGHGGQLQPCTVRRLGDVRDGYTYMANGDVTFAKISPSFQNRKGGLADNLTNGLAFGTTELTVLRPSREVDPRYLQYAISSDDFIQRGTATLHGVAGQQRVDSRWVANYRLPLPCLTTQRRVVDILDVETKRIDSLIAKNDRATQLFRLRLAETVSQAVTEGVFGRDTRPVNLGWASHISQDWDVAPYQYVARIGTGHTPSRSEPAYWEDCNIPWITTSDVKAMRPGRIEKLEATEYQISELGLANSAAALHPSGTVVLSRTASVGFSAIMGVEMATSQDFFTWTCGDRLSPEYLLYVLRAMKSRGHFDRMMYGSTHKTIYFPDLMQLRGPLPPVEEQHQIVAHVRRQTGRLHELLDRMVEMTLILHRRRQAVITAAVTGQIDV